MKGMFDMTWTNLFYAIIGGLTAIVTAYTKGLFRYETREKIPCIRTIYNEISRKYGGKSCSYIFSRIKAKW